LPLSFFRPLVYGIFSRLRRGNFDVLWLHGWGYFSHIRAIFYAKMLGIKVILRGESFRPYQGALKSPLKFLFSRFLRCCGDGFLTIGTLNRNFYKSIGIPETLLFDCPYAVDNEFFSPLRSGITEQKKVLANYLGLNDKSSVILYAGKLTERKRVDLVVKSYVSLIMRNSGLEDCHLIVVGTGELMPLAVELAGTIASRNIHFVGFKNQSQLVPYYALADIFVLPSYNEPWGLAINEAMCAGCAIVTTSDVGAAVDLVRPGYNGVIIPANDAEALENALLALLSDPTLLSNMCEASKELIQRWDFFSNIRGIKDCISHVTGDKP